MWTCSNRDRMLRWSWNKWRFESCSGVYGNQHYFIWCLCYETWQKIVDSSEDNIRQKVAMNKLTSESTRSEISTRFKDVLRSYSSMNISHKLIIGIKISLNKHTKTSRDMLTLFLKELAHLHLLGCLQCVIFVLF